VTVRVGLDIGGTKCAGALVDETGLRSEVVTAPTRTSSPEALVEGAAQVVEALLASADGESLAVDGVGIGIAGLVDESRRVVRFAPHLPLVEDATAARFEARLDLTVMMENDATAAAWGEYLRGAGRGAASLLMVSVGTGIGGGLVLDGKLVRGTNGMAGEIGHIPFVPDGHPCPCGARGCWEQYASGNALGRRAREIAHESSLLLDLAGGDAAEITGHTVRTALNAEDPIAQQLLADLGHDLGVGIAGLVSVLDPQVVVLGGGLSELGPSLLEAARESMSSRLIGARHRQEPMVRLALLGSTAALIGAALDA
jgi:glucokinase